VIETTIINYFKTSTIRRPDIIESSLVTFIKLPISLTEFLGPDHNSEIELEKNIITLKRAEIIKEKILLFKFFSPDEEIVQNLADNFIK
jgi:hypothetical protein